MADVDLLAIGAVARLADVTVGTIRFYEEIGLISATTRVGGKRRFNAGVVEQIRFVRRAQAAGFTLEEIGKILWGAPQNWSELLAAKLVELTKERARIDAMLALLTQVDQCGCQGPTGCDHAESTESGSTVLGPTESGSTVSGVPVAGSGREPAGDS